VRTRRANPTAGRLLRIGRYPTVFLQMTGLRLNEFADLRTALLPRFAAAQQRRQYRPRGLQVW
jgi:hypothetical protein